MTRAASALCPVCRVDAGFDAVPPTGPWESLLVRLAGRRPVRCRACGYRFRRARDASPPSRAPSLSAGYKRPAVLSRTRVRERPQRFEQLISEMRKKEEELDRRRVAPRAPKPNG